MEQNVMFYQSMCGNFRAKGSKVNKPIQAAFLLVVCLWLLYEMKHPHDDPKSYGGNTHRKLCNEHATTLVGLGKQNVGFQDGAMSSTDSDRIGEGREDGGSSEDKDRDSKEEAAESNYEGKHEESARGEVEEKSARNGSENWYGDRGDRVEEEDESGRDRDEEKSAFGTSEMGDNESGFYGFHDENGVPPDALNLVNSTSYDTVWTA